MEQIKQLHETVGDSIPDILAPTFKTFIPLLLKNKQSIFEVTSETKQYGEHPRQKLDIYASTTKEPGPLLVFFYGGGLVRGDKVIPGIPEGIIYRNLGAFFAKRGITTVVADYRRVNSEFGGEDAVFPSGGDDVAAVFKFLETASLEPASKKNVFVMGNSAGAVHMSTFMLHPKFAEQRAALLSGAGKVVWKGAVQVGVPSHFNTAAPDRMDMLKAYYGTTEEVKQHQPIGLLEAAAATGKSREETHVPETLAFVGEWDPEDEIAGPMRHFVELWKKTWGGIELRTIAGHNHISPPMALMSGEGEQWGEDAAVWIKGLTSK